MVAGLARQLVLGRPWAERLRHAVALGSAAVAAPVAGEFRQADYEHALGQVSIIRVGTGLMPLTGLQTVVTEASAAGHGAGAFNVIGIEHAEAIVAGAEAAGAPVVLQISENCVRYHGALRPIGQASLAIAAAAAVPVAVHLDHATSEELVTEARPTGVRLGHVRRIDAPV